MATLISDLADYIAEQASLTVDTDLFIGAEVPNIVGTFAVLRDIPGSIENWSGLEQIHFQLMCTGNSYVDSKMLADQLYEVIKHKPGFADADLITHNVFYCEPTSLPYPVGRDDQGGYIFSVNFLIKKE